MRDSDSTLTRLTWALVILTIILVILTGILLFDTVKYATDAQKYALESQKYANESAIELQNLANYYRIPEPILTNWTDKGSFSYLQIPDYLIWKKFHGYDERTAVENLPQEASEITIYLWNSGMVPARYLTVDINFEIPDYNTSNPTYPYPIKIYNITTPVDFLGYVNFLDGNYIDATMHGGGVILANSSGSRIKFLPELENSSHTVDFPKDIKLGNIAPNDITSFTIRLFAYGNVNGKMIVHIKELNNKELQTISIPLQTY